MIFDDVVEAYTLASGILLNMHREAAARRPGVLTKVGVDTFVDPRRQGGAMNQRTPRDFIKVVEFEGEEWLFFKSIIPQVAIIRATTADEKGNLTMEHEGAYLGALDHALAGSKPGWSVIAPVQP